GCTHPRSRPRYGVPHRRPSTRVERRARTADRYSTQALGACTMHREEAAVIELVRRTFEVDASIQQAWAHLARVESWLSWAKHIKSVTLNPAGMLTAASEGQFRLKGGALATFRVEEFDPPRRWRWVGPFLSVRVHYDHWFADADGRTRLTW